METWAIVEEAPNYVVSNEGRVQNRLTGRILKPGFAGKKGYAYVVLSNNGPQFNRYIHTLVATYFCAGWEPGLEVNHLNGDHTFNHAWNLEWTTHQDNLQHASRLGLVGKKVQVIETGYVYPNISTCARAIGGWPGDISHCLSGRRKSHRGYTFEFVEN